MALATSPFIRPKSPRKASIESTSVPQKGPAECIGRFPVAVKTLTACSSFNTSSSRCLINSSSPSSSRAMLTSCTSSKSSLKKLCKALFERN